MIHPPLDAELAFIVATMDGVDAISEAAGLPGNFAGVASESFGTEWLERAVDRYAPRDFA